MGMLDSDDGAVKNHLRYKEAVKAMESLTKEVKSFKEKGGTSGLVRGLSQAVLRSLRECDNGAKQFPDFAEWPKMRAEALEVGKALVQKYPTSSDINNIKPFVEDPNKRV